MPLRSLFEQNNARNDTHHQGVRQAGFKGLMSYRTDIGIPGYTGYVPSSLGLAIPIKASEHTGRGPNDALQKDAVTETNKTIAAPTEYMSRFQPEPDHYKRPDKHGGGYWFATRGTLGESLPFRATTTYKKELEHAAETVAKQMQAVDGVPCTTATYEVARTRRSVSAGALRPGAHGLTRTTSSGDTVGYKTTYQSMLFRSPMTPLRYKHAKSSDDLDTTDQSAQAPSTVLSPPQLDGLTIYKQNFGDLGFDPMLRTAPSEKEMTRMATTAELAEGTTRNTVHIPGYCGFMAASKCNPRAQAHSVGVRPRADNKANMLLFDLDQYPRSRLPKYTGFKPQAPCNITSTQPSNLPLASTTKGSTEQELLLQSPMLSQLNGKIHSHKQTDGIVGFFQGGGEFVSANGMSDAQRYYTMLRPLEGRPKFVQASKTTEYGRRFLGTNASVA